MFYYLYKPTTCYFQIRSPSIFSLVFRATSFLLHVNYPLLCVWFCPMSCEIQVVPFHSISIYPSFYCVNVELPSVSSFLILSLLVFCMIFLNTCILFVAKILLVFLSIFRILQTLGELQIYRFLPWLLYVNICGSM